MKNNLEKILKEKKLTVTKVSQDTGIARLTISNLRDNKSGGISFDVLDKLCTYLDCSVGDFFNDSNEI